MKGLCKLLFVVFVLAVGALSGCGGNRQLQSLTVSPDTATQESGFVAATATMNCP